MARWVCSRILAYVQKPSFQAAFLLALAALLAHFLLAPTFGFYEDDYAHVTPGIAWSIGDALRRLAWVFVYWPQGRPLNFFLPGLFSFLGSRLGSIEAIYGFALVIVALNAWLFYRVLRRAGGGPLALYGALAFCLFPADTTQAFLTHSFHLQISLTFFLVSTLCYLAGRRRLAYAVALGSLLSYETVFPLLFAVPLLRNRWNRRLAKELLVNGAILILIMLGVVAVRFALGEERIVEDVGGNLGQIPWQLLTAMALGPLTAELSWLRGPARVASAVSQGDLLVSAAAITAFALLYWALGKLGARSSNQQCPAAEGEEATRGEELLAWAVSPALRRPAKLLAAGVVMLLLAYVLSFTHDPSITYGRLTSVHLAATVGSSLILACVIAMGLSLAHSAPARRCAIVVVALYLSSLVGYGMLIQEDYRQAWANQKAFWGAVVELCPDLEDGTVVLATAGSLPQTDYILTHSWAEPLILSQIFRFPADWQTPPGVFVVNDDWQKEVKVTRRGVEWEVRPWGWAGHWKALPDGKVILLLSVDGLLTRSEGSLVVQGQTLHLKEREPATGQSFERGALYEPLVVGSRHLR